MGNVYVLRCGLQIGGGKCKQVFWFYQRQCVRKNLSERACQREHPRNHQSQIVRESMSETITESVSKSVRVRLPEIACQCFVVSERVPCQDCQRQC